MKKKKKKEKNIKIYVAQCTHQNECDTFDHYYGKIFLYEQSLCVCMCMSVNWQSLKWNYIRVIMLFFPSFIFGHQNRAFIILNVYVCVCERGTGEHHVNDDGSHFGH